MKSIELSKAGDSNLTIMLFCEGTILKPKSPFSLYSHKSYVPIGDCITKISAWQQQGARIIYCTSRKGKHAEDMAELLRQYGFPGGTLYYREKGDHYKDILERIIPDVLIEDDCRSIGGTWQMCITKTKESVRDQIKLIVVKEFKGIDHLQDELPQLLI